MAEKYTVLSPWAASKAQIPNGIAPRLETLENKTIGMYAHFKKHAVDILEITEEELRKICPTAKFSYFQYPHALTELKDEAEWDAKLKQWLAGVDAVIASYGDAGSCAMFLCHNMAYLEQLGKPTVTLIHDRYEKAAHRGGSARSYPGLRLVKTPLEDLSHEPVIDTRVREERIRPVIVPVVNDIAAGLTRPLTEDEAAPQPKKDYSSERYTGTIEDLNNTFYRLGWTNGLPMLPPTEEAVEAMLAGTDLPRDYVVGKIPPMNGYATVEKIAVNAVMAGCLPTYMPVLIAAVRCMLDPKIQLLGWTCSNATWMPTSILSGPVTKALNVNCGRAVLSPYYKPNSAIPRAIAHLIMNIGGVRQGTEDMSLMGTIGRFGVLIGEDPDKTPWKPLHTMYGLAEEDSAITMFWPNEIKVGSMGRTPKEILRQLCDVKGGGWAPGCLFVMAPEMARTMAQAGFNQKRILNYIVEYDRSTSNIGQLRWVADNNHLPENIDIPMDAGYSTRVFWNCDHLLLAVAGCEQCTAFTGGGDHGGPATVKIEFPKNWDSLVEKYRTVVPDYIDY